MEEKSEIVSTGEDSDAILHSILKRPNKRITKKNDFHQATITFLMLTNKNVMESKLKNSRRIKTMTKITRRKKTMAMIETMREKIVLKLKHQKMKKMNTMKMI